MPVQRADAGAAVHASPDAGAAPSSEHVEPDLNTLVAAFWTEFTHEVHVTCPCRVEQHVFATVQECERMFEQMMGDLDTWIDCATRSLVPSDSPELRASLRCNVERFSRRAGCLETHSCDPDEMNACYELGNDCAVDGQAFTPVFYNCVMSSQP